MPRTHHSAVVVANAIRVAGGVTIVALAATIGAGCTGGPFGTPPPPPGPGRVDVVALAGPDLVALEGSRVVLTGNASRALGGDPQLSWAQTAGPSVLLSNPSSQNPIFVAPLAPATLTFQLTAEAEGAVATDTVNVVVESAPSSTLPVFLTVPADATAAPGSKHSFEVGVPIGGAPSDVTLTAVASCDAGASVSIGKATSSGIEIDVTLPDALPCIVVVDGKAKDGRGVAPAARVFWPADAVLPATTHASVLLPDAHGHDHVVAGQIDPDVDGYHIATNDDDASGAVTRVWPASGDTAVLGGGFVGDVDPFVPPRTNERFVLAMERRLDGKSGAVQYVRLDVAAGTDTAPIARGGPDRVVLPGARFKIDPSASSDINHDPLAISITQVVGPTATPDPNVTGIFTAPSDAGDVTLLFHVVADDGLVASQPDSVRVIVSSGTEDQAPTLSLPPTRFVVPGEVFVLDGSGAEDDSGVIASTTISESPDDTPALLTAPVDAATVTLTAGAAGEVYHFQIAAFDDEGLGVTVEQTITVEDAGPYVDPVRGDDQVGNGTALAPFATVVAALPTAVRHELPELLLAEGAHAALSTTLPPRLSLRGAQHFDEATSSYVDGGAETVLPVGGSASTGLSIVDGALSDLTVHLAQGSLVLEGTSALSHVRVDEEPAHTDAMIVVNAGAEVNVTSSTIAPGAPHDDASCVLADGAAMTLSQSTIAGAPSSSSSGVVAGFAAGDVAIGVHATHATLSLGGAHITGGAGAVTSIGVLIEAGSVVDATSSTITGGDGGSATGMSADDTLVTLDDDTVVTGASADATSGTALAFSGRDRSALVHASLFAGSPGAVVGTATAFSGVDAQVSLLGAALDAEGSDAVALAIDGGVLVVNGATVNAGITGFSLAGVVEAQIVDTTVTAPTGIRSADAATVELDGATVTSTLAAIAAPLASVTLSHASVTTSGAGSVSGIEALSLQATEQSSVVVRGNDVVVVKAGDTLLSRSTLSANAAGGACTVVDVSAATLTVQSSFLTSSGGAAGCTTIDAGGAVTLRHATIVTDQTALKIEGGGSLDAANSVLDGDPAIVTTKGTPWTRASALAFQTGTTFVNANGTAALTQSDLDNLGCGSCLIVDVPTFVDDTGHLTAGQNDLVDNADATLSLPDDIDGDIRPQGPRPDIGSDERTP